MAYIDVVIPVFNCVKYLNQAVHSVLEQPYKDIHIILVDDGSTDGSEKLCDSIAHEFPSRVEVIHQSNQGVSCARNTGIEISLSRDDEGDVAFLDADDFWVNNVFTESKVKEIKKSHASLIALGFVICNEKGEKCSTPTVYREKICDGGEQIIWDLKTHFGSNLYGKNLLNEKKIRFIEGLRYSEDKIFLQQAVVLSQKVFFTEFIFYIQRKNDSSAMRKREEISITEIWLPIIDGWIKSDEFINRVRSSAKRYTAGEVLAGIYFMDMAAEYCMRHGSLKKILKICRAHPKYFLFINLPKKQIKEKQFKNHNLLLFHPRLFEIKYNILGYIINMGRKLIRTSFGTKLLDKKRFPNQLSELQRQSYI